MTRPAITAKAIKPEAEGRGQGGPGPGGRAEGEGSSTTVQAPATLLTPVAVTKDNIMDTVVGGSHLQGLRHLQRIIRCRVRQLV